MNNAFLLTGGNIGDRRQNLEKASQLIEQKLGKMIASSPIYETGAWGIEAQPAFLNQVLHVQTNFSVHELLTSVLTIEKEMGRQRDLKYGPRVIDIDILLFNNNIVNKPDLVVPHPELQNRRFVLVPLNEVASTYLHPVLLKTVAQLLAECKDPLSVKLFTK